MTMVGASFCIVFKAGLGITCCLGHTCFFRVNILPVISQGTMTPLNPLFVPVPPQSCSLHLLTVLLRSGLTATGPSTALSSLLYPVSALTPPGTALALGEPLASPRYGPVWAQDQPTRKQVSCTQPPETGKLLGQGFLKGTALRQALMMRTMNGGNRTRSAWIPGVENLKSPMRLTAEELTFQPKPTTYSIMLAANNS